MTSSAAPGFEAAQAEFFALIEREPELRSSLSAIAEEIEFSKTSVTDRNLSEWLTWLDEEGYDAQVVRDHSESFAILLRNAGICQNISSETRTDELIQELKEAPNLLELLFSLVDHSSSLHSELIGTAGGTGAARSQIVAQKLGVNRKNQAIREAGDAAREMSGTEKGSDARGVADRISTAREGQFMNDNSNLNDRNLEPRRDEINGQGQGAADRISTAREGQFMNDNNSNLDDRGLEPRRDEINGQGQGAADRISTAREGRYMNNEGGIDDRNLEPRRDERPTGGQREVNREINAEMRETDPGMLGDTENPRETPRDGIGGVAQDGADRVSRVEDRSRSEAKRYERVEMQDLRDAGREEVGRVAQEVGDRFSTTGKPYEEAAMQDLREAGPDEIDRVAQEGADRIRTAEERYEKAEIAGLRDAALDEIGRVAKDGSVPNRSEVERVERAEINDQRDAARDEINRVERDVTKTVVEGERDIDNAERAANNERRETQPGR